ncbi:MAG: PepSY domain-containing protein [Pseudomonadales bacterium]
MNAPAHTRNRSFRLLCLVLAVLCAGSPALAAQWPSWAAEGAEPQSLVKPPGISLEQATNMVRRETGGRVLSATPVTRGGETGFEVRVLIDGKRVTKVYVDGQGRIRSQR